MKLIFTLFLFTSICFTSFSQQTLETVQINGTTRQYYQYLPTNYDPQTEEVPLVFMLHGLGGTASGASTWGMNNIADTARFIMIYPQGLNNFQGNPSWNNGTLLASSGEDILFISSIMDTLNSEQNINLARVYMSGVSMGSIMTYTLCNAISDRIAAAACHIGTMSDTDLNNYNPEYPVPVLHKHGTNDATVPYDGTALPSLSLVPATIDKLKDINDWQGDSTVTTIADNASDGITVDRIVYNCTTPLELWRMNNADHILLFEPFNDTNTTEVTWGWFQQFTHPNPSTASIKDFSIEQADFYPNPVKDHINLTNYKNFRRLMISTLDGKLQAEIEINAEEIQIPSLRKGMYLFHFVDTKEQKSTQQVLID